MRSNRHRHGMRDLCQIMVSFHHVKAAWYGMNDSNSKELCAKLLIFWRVKGQFLSICCWVKFSHEILPCTFGYPSRCGPIREQSKCCCHFLSACFLLALPLWSSQVRYCSETRQRKSADPPNQWLWRMKLEAWPGNLILWENLFLHGGSKIGTQDGALAGPPGSETLTHTHLRLPKLGVLLTEAGTSGAGALAWRSYKDLPATKRIKQVHSLRLTWIPEGLCKLNQVFRSHGSFHVMGEGSRTK